MNQCKFSPCRLYRYRLDHHFEPQLGGFKNPTLLPWCGLNPSTADEGTLDPTLRRIAAFSRREGYAGFTMLNLFAYRATDPMRMMRVADPVGGDNNRILLETCERAGRVVCAWGADGAHMDRDAAVLFALAVLGVETLCIGWPNKNGTPAHPLYLAGNTPILPFLQLASAHAAA